MMLSFSCSARRTDTESSVFGSVLLTCECWRSPQLFGFCMGFLLILLLVPETVAWNKTGTFSATECWGEWVRGTRPEERIPRFRSLINPVPANRLVPQTSWWLQTRVEAAVCGFQRVYDVSFIVHHFYHFYHFFHDFSFSNHLSNPGWFWLKTSHWIRSDNESCHSDHWVELPKSSVWRTNSQGGRTWQKPFETNKTTWFLGTSNQVFEAKTDVLRSTTQ